MLTRKLLALLFLMVLFRPDALGQFFDPSSITMYWLDEEGHPLLTFDNVRKKDPELVFLTNGGRFNTRHEPMGLYIEKGKLLRGLKITNNPKLMPASRGEGVFYIRDGRAHVEPLQSNLKLTGIQYAVQAEPMLVINGKSNPKLSHKSRVLMRNGVGLTRDGRVYFACFESSERNFAAHFIEAGCIQALQLDASVSRVWHKNIKEKVYGRFGVMIGANK